MAATRGKRAEVDVWDVTHLYMKISCPLFFWASTLMRLARCKNLGRWSLVSMTLMTTRVVEESEGSPLSEIVTCNYTQQTNTLEYSESTALSEMVICNYT